MSSRDDRREWPKSQLAWGIYNFGLLIRIAHRRRDAVFEVEVMTGKPWSEAKAFMEVHRVRIERYAP